ncbi:chromosome partitioning protein ParA [Haloferax mediterranei ATCC 33500]|uniref:Cell division inhibitor MinD-like (ATPase involved in chromosome partitioning) n=1 Tax=Haloferax mediterranei (strain ATCC 33500 / DSM 1411 / JCM 8866 / NBRC 14739 / NCIMB 2177 / R-4) TaxID=523841 RepID=I3R161_HALMT|nr:AAA family ATPase [Haloferax mediterranei]AFK17971.1 cell division inhibitor MinD-like (ATPase involved in chromosome partitioning) [Haloferax mediterranei ATCC 33500]AHZ22608.1 chromosome partitioning protein ParA [Haloferax mediterranei ATCC 33500]EMA02752.1 cell division inhibitor MinD-like (ATPase involved in chromosome partitioning) [Haloferax mediterranei ATCC 33500]MDX5988063.1 AAA family ATPase [Haloferax mediterranei ATCC 33500]QCQ74522.1 chromosome partitioning protein ParA [Halof
MILAVVSGKGGVGKSTLSFELGAALDAVVVDADLGMANLPYAPGPDLHDVLAGRADPTEAVREGAPVSILPCGRTLAGARAADVRRLDDVLHAVEAAYGTVVVDCPAGMRANAGVPLAIADACVVVASPKRYALADAVRTRELARELGCGLAAVAVNRTVDDPPLDAFADVLGAPATAIPADTRLSEAVDRFEPVVTASPNSLPSTRIRELASAVRVCGR